MISRTAWFIAGLVMLALLAMFAPRAAGVIAFLVVIVLAINLSKKGTI